MQIEVSAAKMYGLPLSTQWDLAANPAVPSSSSPSSGGKTFILYANKEVLQEMPYACDVLVPLAWISHWSRVYQFVTSLEPSLLQQQPPVHQFLRAATLPRHQAVSWGAEPPAFPDSESTGRAVRANAVVPSISLKQTCLVPRGIKMPSAHHQTAPLADRALGVFLLFQAIRFLHDASRPRMPNTCL